MKAVADRIIVEPIPSENKVGDIQLHASRKRPRRAVIISRGPDCKVAQVEDTVLFSEGAGVEIEIGGKPIFIMRETDILAIL